MMRVMHTRCWAALVAVAAVAGACSSGGGADDVPAVTVADTTADVEPLGTAPADVAAKIAAAEPVASSAPPTTEPAPLPHVSVDVAIGPNTSVVAGDVPGGAPVDLFGDFAACSGLRDSVANWSLQVSDPDQTLTAVSILTAAGVSGPGAYPGTFRVEFVNGAALDGVGTVTLEPGLQSGTFAATDADVRGTFACTGAPEPATVDAPDVEVVALLRRGSAERMISLAEPYSADTACDTAAGRLHVAGDGGIGGRVGLTIDGDTLALSVDGVDLGIDPAHTELAVEGTTGTFHAVTLDGMEIDGALTCAPG